MVVCDREYPQRVAFTLINRVLDEFSAQYSRDVWLSTTRGLSFSGLKETLEKYQNPHEADKIMKVQKELDDTKVILVRASGLLSLV